MLQSLKIFSQPPCIVYTGASIAIFTRIFEFEIFFSKIFSVCDNLRENEKVSRKLKKTEKIWRLLLLLLPVDLEFLNGLLKISIKGLKFLLQLIVKK